MKKKWKKMKKWTNEKKKRKKNGEKRWKKKEKWKKLIHTQNPLRFPGFTVVVVICFFKILDDFHDFVSECVSFPRKINNPFWVVIVFPKKSDNFHWTWNKNTHFTDENQRKIKSLRSAHLTIIILLEKYNHSTTTTTTIIQSGEAPFQQARSLHPTLGSWSMLSPKQAAQPNPSYPALCRQDTTSPWSTDYGGNI